MKLNINILKQKKIMIMKRGIIVGLCVCLFCLSLKGQQKGSFVIYGQITDISDTTHFYLIRALNGKPDTVASIRPSDGKFTIKGNVSSGAEWYFLKKKGTKNYVTIFLDNSAVTLNGTLNDWPNYSIKGSKSHDDYQEFIKLFDPLKNELLSLNDELKKNSDSIKKEITNQKISTVKLKIKSIWNSYIKQNLQSFYTPYLIMKSDLNALEKEVAYNSLSLGVKSSKYGIELNEALQLSKLNNISIGAKAHDFTSLTPEGKKLSLSEVTKKGKLTLIDFWGSWCKPCRAEVPNLKKVYAAFHDKGFNVLGVALETNELAWKKAIAEDKTTWMHVSQIKGRNEEAAKIYSINGVPSYMLLDADGKIIAMDFPGSTIPSGGGSLRGDELYKKVGEILGKGK